MATQQLGLGFKIGTTAIIWGFATGMLGICVPLVSITKSGIILPLAVILGATISTIAVWLSSNQKVSKITNDKKTELENLES